MHIPASPHIQSLSRTFEIGFTLQHNLHTRHGRSHHAIATIIQSLETTSHTSFRQGISLDNGTAKDDATKVVQTRIHGTTTRHGKLQDTTKNLFGNEFEKERIRNGRIHTHGKKKALPGKGNVKHNHGRRRSLVELLEECTLNDFIHLGDTRL